MIRIKPREWADFKITDFSWSFLSRDKHGFTFDVFVKKDGEDQFVTLIHCPQTSREAAVMYCKSIIQVCIQEAQRLREREIGGDWSHFEELDDGISERQ
jgi:hypothetical protein